jgi:hypothetical protein
MWKTVDVVTATPNQLLLRQVCVTMRMAEVDARVIGDLAERAIGARLTARSPDR